MKIEGAPGVRKTVGGLKSAVLNPNPHMKRALPHYKSSVQKNFGAGGRPKKWPAKVDGSPSFLRGKTGLLVGTISSKVEGNTIVIGSPRIYSSVHNFGETITFKTRPISIQMPKREFMIIVPEDQEVGAKIIAESMAQESGIK